MKTHNKEYLENQKILKKLNNSSDTFIFSILKYGIAITLFSLWIFGGNFWN